MTLEGCTGSEQTVTWTSSRPALLMIIMALSEHKLNAAEVRHLNSTGGSCVSEEVLLYDKDYSLL